MLAFSSIGILLLVVTNLMPIDAQNTYTVDQLCALTKDGTKIADPAQCGSYYVCKTGTATPATCAGDMAYDKDNQKCTTTSCKAVAENPCEGQATGSFVADSTDCNGYYYCAANEVAKHGNCPSGLDFQNGNCVYSSVSSCTTDSSTVTTNDVCSFMPNGVFFGSPANCKSYNVCVNDALQSSGECQFVFNPTTQSCDYTSNYPCVQTAYPDIINENCTESENMAIPTPNAPCNQYYSCVAVNSDSTQWKLTNCTNGYFDNSTLTCTAATDAVNSDCNRCTSYNSGFAVGTTNCSSYYVCNSGQSYDNTEYYCPDSLYFNQTMQACVPNDPEYPCCSTTD